MPFNPENFAAAQYEARIKEIPVPELKEFFDKDEKPIWKIRNLTTTEQLTIEAAVKEFNPASKIAEAITEAIAVQDMDNLKKSVRDVQESTPSDLVRRKLMLVKASVDGCTPQIAIRLSEFNSEVFFRLTNGIHNISAKGMCLLK